VLVAEDNVVDPKGLFFDSSVPLTPSRPLPPDDEEEEGKGFLTNILREVSVLSVLLLRIPTDEEETGVCDVKLSSPVVFDDEDAIVMAAGDVATGVVFLYGLCGLLLLGELYVFRGSAISM